MVRKINKPPTPKPNSQPAPTYVFNFYGGPPGGGGTGGGTGGGQGTPRRRANYNNKQKTAKGKKTGQAGTPTTGEKGPGGVNDENMQ